MGEDYIVHCGLGGCFLQGALVIILSGIAALTHPEQELRDPGFKVSARACALAEVIQPQVPLRLPCYDFIPVTSLALGPCLLAVGADTSSETSFHDVTGGVYKTRERIHGAVADAPLLAIPASWRRIAASNLN